MEFEQELYKIATSNGLDYANDSFHSHIEGLYFDKNNNKIILSIDGDNDRFNLVNNEICKLLQGSNICFTSYKSKFKMTNTMEYQL